MYNKWRNGEERPKRTMKSAIRQICDGSREGSRLNDI